LLYRFSSNNLEKAVYNNLKTAAVNKSNWIRSYLAEQERNMEVLASTQDANSAFIKIMNYYRKDRFYDIDKSIYKKIYKEMDPFFSSYLDVYGYHDIFFIGAAYGHVMYTAQRETPLGTNLGAGKYKDSALAKLWKKVVEEKKVSYVDFEYYAPSKQPAMFIGAPAIDQDGEVFAVVALQISIKEINEAMKDMTGLGLTGDTYLVGKDYLMRSDSRFSKASTILKQKIETANIKSHFSENKTKKDNVNLFKNYRGVDVLSTSVFVPEMQWVLVAEISQIEALAPLRELLYFFLVVGVFLIIVIYLSSDKLGSMISKPIIALEKGTEIIMKGNLDHKVGLRINDEIGQLSQAFDNMTGKLKESYEGLEEKVRQRTKDLQKVNKELDSFVYTASHDLRAPLRGISSFATFLFDDYGDKLDEEGKDNVMEIKRGADRMDELIDDLLELSRISRIKNPYESVNIKDMIDSVLERISFDVSENNVEIEVGDNMPTIVCDRIKLAEVFLNLINNGIKFSLKNDKENPKLKIRYRDKDRFHQFSVQDNGIGIDPMFKDQIFGLFKRLHRVGEYEGTGAGLSIVKSVIDDHDGKIWVESELGKGAKFVFNIPKGLKNIDDEDVIKENEDEMQDINN